MRAPETLPPRGDLIALGVVGVEAENVQVWSVPRLPPFMTTVTRLLLEVLMIPQSSHHPIGLLPRL